MITFVRETQGLDFAGAIEWLAERFRIPLEYEERSPGEDGRSAAAATRLLRRCSTRRRRSTSAYLWDSQAGSFARDYLAGRGLGEEICREFRLGLALGGDALARKALEKGFTREELRARRPDAASAAATTSSAGCSSRSPTRAAACVGFQARQLHEDDPLHGEVRQHAGVASSSTRARSSTGSTRRARRSRKRGPRAASSRATPT